MGDIVRRGTRWYVRYKDVDGTRRMRACHQPTRELARRYLLAVESRVARCLIGIPEPPPPAPTLAELAERFLREYSRPRIKDLTAYRAHAGKCLRRVLPTLGCQRADALQPADIQRARDELGRSRSPASVRSALAYLSTMFSWAQRLQLVPHNPVRGVERPPAPASADFFSQEEAARILRCAAELSTGTRRDRLLAACVHLALHTGLRKGELLGLRWQDLDLTSQRLTVARSYKTAPKSGRSRHLRLPAACVPVLQDWRPHCPLTPDGLVFPVERGRGRSTHALLGLPRLLRAAGVRVPAHPFHTCRHSFASHYVMQGGNLVALQKILGHSEIKLTMIYAHLAPDFLGSEMDRLKF
jgi:integrase